MEIKNGENEMKNKKGFTLIELLVVVLIIGILVAIAVPQYQKAVSKSRYTQLKLLAQSIAEAQEAYYLANGTYTTNVANLDINIGGSSSSGNNYLRNFDWGHCAIYAGSFASVYCSNNKIGMGYQVYYNSSKNTPSTRYCVCKTDSIQEQICKDETGKKSAYSIESSNGISYYLY